MSGLIIHLPATLPAFGHWLAAHWPAAPRGCQWQLGGRVHQAATWRLFCRR